MLLPNSFALGTRCSLKYQISTGVNYNQILPEQIKRQLLQSCISLLESSNVLTGKAELFPYVGATVYAFAQLICAWNTMLT